MFYLSIFSFKKKPYEMMTGLSHEIFIKNFKLLIKSKIQYKINFTLTKYNIDELPFLIKNFNNYQIETVHDFRGQLKRQDFILENMKNIDFVARPTNTPEHLKVSSFSITYT
jgi:MoaA/NifB/PqqE/SkfB family radical SAM enzyme